MAQADHIRCIFMDRAAFARLERQSIEATRSQPGQDIHAADSTALTIAIDGMDQVGRAVGACVLFLPRV